MAGEPQRARPGDLAGLTIDQWAQKWEEERDAGRRVINFERYETSNGIRYLGVWRQNN